jgi:hypothetical protein
VSKKIYTVNFVIFGVHRRRPSPRSPRSQGPRQPQPQPTPAGHWPLAAGRRPTRAVVLPSPCGERHRRRAAGPRLSTTHHVSPSRPQLTTPTAPLRPPEHAACLGRSPGWLEVRAPRRRPWPPLGSAAAHAFRPTPHGPGQQMSPRAATCLCGAGCAPGTRGESVQGLAHRRPTKNRHGGARRGR